MTLFDQQSLHVADSTFLTGFSLRGTGLPNTGQRSCTIYCCWSPGFICSSGSRTGGSGICSPTGSSCFSCSSWHLPDKHTSRCCCLHSLPPTSSYRIVCHPSDVPPNQLVPPVYNSNSGHSSPHLRQWKGHSLLRPTGLCGPSSHVHCF